MEYRAITGRIFGTVRYENEIAALGGRVETELTLLTLDVASNRENRRTDVGLNFYTADERYVDAGTSFVCWSEQRLTNILSSLTLQSMGIVETREFLINSFPVAGLHVLAVPRRQPGRHELQAVATSLVSLAHGGWAPAQPPSCLRQASM